MAERYAGVISDHQKAVTKVVQITEEVMSSHGEEYAEAQDELMPEGVSVNQDDAAMREYRHNRDKVALEAKIKELEAKNKELNRLYQKAVEGLPT